jgi:acetolactate synthase-1/2/3 large subunit
MVVIAGDIPSYYHGRHPHQEVNLHADDDQVSIYRPFVKRAWRVHRAEDLGRFTERAFWTATSGRPGATVVNVPMDVFSRPVPAEQATTHRLPARSAAPDLLDELADEIAGLLVAAEAPLVYVGGGLSGADGRAALLDLVEHLDIPVAHSLMAKGTIDDAHPLLLGMPGFWGLETTHKYTRDADLVLALATRFAETDASSWEDDVTWHIPSSTLIQIDIDPAEIGRNYPVAVGAVADVTNAVVKIAAAVHRLVPRGRQRADVRAEISSARRALFDETQAVAGDDAFPLRPERILADLLASVPDDTILVTDVGWNKNGVAQRYELPSAGRFITPGGSSTMGFGPAAAVGAQIGAPGRPVVALIGDGGMSAALPALPMAVEQQQPVVFLVMNNAAHGTIADLQQSNFGSTYGCTFRTPDGRPYSPDFAALGRAFGADGYTIDSATELREVLGRAITARRPTVIDVPMINEKVPTPGHWNITDIYHGVFDQEVTS